MEKPEYRIKFWGVRGSRPVPGPDTLKYGGNTPCVQVQIGEKLIILDAGTGICNLGKALMKKNGSLQGDIFFSHVHWDHIQGFPFFSPAYAKGSLFRLYGEPKNNTGFEEQMSAFMKNPYFPIKIDSIKEQIEMYDIRPGQEVCISPDIAVKAARNHHPDGSISYRIEHGGRSCCYVTDTEHYEEVDPILREFIRGADVVIYDANYTDEEYYGRNGQSPTKGWGHSTWREGVKLVEAAGAGRLVLFHHHTDRTDREQDEINIRAQEIYPHCVSAWEGLELVIA